MAEPSISKRRANIFKSQAGRFLTPIKIQKANIGQNSNNQRVDTPKQNRIASYGTEILENSQQWESFTLETPSESAQWKGKMVDRSNGSYAPDEIEDLYINGNDLLSPVDEEIAPGPMETVLQMLNRKTSTRPRYNTSNSNRLSKPIRKRITQAPPPSPSSLPPSPMQIQGTNETREYMEQQTFQDLIRRDREAHILMQDEEGIRKWWAENRKIWLAQREKLDWIEGKEELLEDDNELRLSLTGWFITNRMIMKQVWKQFVEAKKRREDACLAAIEWQNGEAMEGVEEFGGDSEASSVVYRKRAKRRRRGIRAEKALFGYVNVDDIRQTLWFRKFGPRGIVRWHELAQLEFVRFKKRVEGWLEMDRGELQRTEQRGPIIRKNANPYLVKTHQVKIQGLQLQIVGLEADIIRANVLVTLLDYIRLGILQRYLPEHIPDEDWELIISPIQMMLFSHQRRRELQNRLWNVTSKLLRIQNSMKIYELLEQYCNRNLITHYHQDHESLRRSVRVQEYISSMQQFLKEELILFQQIVNSAEGIIATEAIMGPTDPNPYHRKPLPEIPVQKAHPPKPTAKKVRSSVPTNLHPSKPLPEHSIQKQSPTLSPGIKRRAEEEPTGSPSSKRKPPNPFNETIYTTTLISSLLSQIPQINLAKPPSPNTTLTWHTLLTQFFLSPDIFPRFNLPQESGTPNTWTFTSFSSLVNSLLETPVPDTILTSYLIYCTKQNELFHVHHLPPNHQLQLQPQPTIQINPSSWLAVEESAYSGPARSSFPHSRTNNITRPPPEIEKAESAFQNLYGKGWFLERPRVITIQELRHLFHEYDKVLRFTIPMLEEFVEYWTQVGRFYVFLKQASGGGDGDGERFVLRVDEGWELGGEGVEWLKLGGCKPRGFEEVEQRVLKTDLLPVLSRREEGWKRCVVTKEEALYDFLFLRGLERRELAYDSDLVTVTRRRFHFFLRWCSENKHLFTLDRAGTVTIINNGWFSKRGNA